MLQRKEIFLWDALWPGKLDLTGGASQSCEGRSSPRKPPYLADALCSGTQGTENGKYPRPQCCCATSGRCCGGRGRWSGGGNCMLLATWGRRSSQTGRCPVAACRKAALWPRKERRRPVLWRHGAKACPKGGGCKGERCGPSQHRAKLPLAVSGPSRKARKKKDKLLFCIYPLWFLCPDARRKKEKAFFYGMPFGRGDWILRGEHLRVAKAASLPYGFQA